MTSEEQVEYFKERHNATQHYFDNDPDCVFCGCFGPVEENLPCKSREDIGKQVAFLISKLRRIKSLASDAGYDRGHDGILAILNEPFPEGK